MEVVGVGATVLVGLAVVAGLVIGLRSLPDLRRYSRIRRM